MIDLSIFFCPNQKCKDYGVRGHGNITISTRYGKGNTHLLRCKTCNQRFSENRNTRPGLGGLGTLCCERS